MDSPEPPRTGLGSLLASTSTEPTSTHRLPTPAPQEEAEALVALAFGLLSGPAAHPSAQRAAQLPEDSDEALEVARPPHSDRQEHEEHRVRAVVSVSVTSPEADASTPRAGVEPLAMALDDALQPFARGSPDASASARTPTLAAPADDDYVDPVSLDSPAAEPRSAEKAVSEDIRVGEHERRADPSESAPARRPLNILPGELPSSDPMEDEDAKFCRRVLSKMTSKRYSELSWPFLQPVVGEDGVDMTEYRRVIAKPMDFATGDQESYLDGDSDVGVMLCTSLAVEHKLNHGFYGNIQEFVHDVSQVFNNAYLFNGRSHPISKLAKKLEAVFRTDLDEHQASVALKSMDPEAQACYRILEELLSDRCRAFVWPFMEPVDPREPGLEAYPGVVMAPMDLATVGQKLRSSMYNNGLDRFFCDLRLIVGNCYLFNGGDHEISRLASKFEQFLDQKIPLLPMALRSKALQGPGLALDAMAGRTPGGPGAGMTTEAFLEEGRRSRGRQLVLGQSMLQAIVAEQEAWERERRRKKREEEQAAQQQLELQVADWFSSSATPAELARVRAHWRTVSLAQLLSVIAHRIWPDRKFSMMEWELSLLWPHRTMLLPTLVGRLLPKRWVEKYALPDAQGVASAKSRSTRSAASGSLGAVASSHDTLSFLQWWPALKAWCAWRAKPEDAAVSLPGDEATTDSSLAASSAVDRGAGGEPRSSGQTGGAQNEGASSDFEAGLQAIREPAGTADSHLLANLLGCLEHLLLHIVDVDDKAQELLRSVEPDDQRELYLGMDDAGARYLVFPTVSPIRLYRALPPLPPGRLRRLIKMARAAPAGDGFGGRESEKSEVVASELVEEDATAMLVNVPSLPSESTAESPLVAIKGELNAESESRLPRRPVRDNHESSLIFSKRNQQKHKVAPEPAFVDAAKTFSDSDIGRGSRESPLDDPRTPSGGRQLRQRPTVVPASSASLLATTPRGSPMSKSKHGNTPKLPASQIASVVSKELPNAAPSMDRLDDDAAARGDPADDLTLLDKIGLDALQDGWLELVGNSRNSINAFCEGLEHSANAAPRATNNPLRLSRRSTQLLSAVRDWLTAAEDSELREARDRVRGAEVVMQYLAGVNHKTALAPMDALAADSPSDAKWRSPADRLEDESQDTVATTVRSMSAEPVDAVAAAVHGHGVATERKGPSDDDARAPDSPPMSMQERKSNDAKRNIVQPSFGTEADGTPPKRTRADDRPPQSGPTRRTQSVSSASPRSPASLAEGSTRQTADGLSSSGRVSRARAHETAQQLALSAAELRPGTVVMAEWPKTWSWYEARVLKRLLSGQYEVEFINDNVRAVVSISQLRRRSAN